jgi:type II secretory ATPase GspE/PulE/Tfp pilus assembly ATPase PilB-like protein
MTAPVEAGHRDEFKIERWEPMPLNEVGRRLETAIKNNAPTTDVASIIFSSASALKASDIHFEAEQEQALLRFRLDGLLYDISRFDKKIYESLLNRIKLVSGLKLNVISTPQDGRFTVKRDNADIEVRVSTIPSEYGETAVLRLLDPSAVALKLVDLGLRSDDLDLANTELKKPNGMVLVTGPTGSGKTTTLYAFLKEVHTSELKSITIEDPIEYHLAGIEQTQVDTERGYTFAAGLRSILRQDPDIILVGEIRDLETAETAIHAALTGHVVFSTLHTNDAVGAIPRLVDMGTKLSTIAPALNLVVAQRLVRKLCDACKMEISPDAALKANIDKFISGLPARVSRDNIKIKLYSPKGCDKCNNGYTGRIGVFELLQVNDELEGVIARDSTEEAIRKFAKSKGMVGLQADGILKTLAGITTLDEVERITGPIEWTY